MRLQEHLRESVQKLRRTPMPIADVAPLLTQAADEIDALRAENERLREALEQLAKLGNGARYGNSTGNEIARAALKGQP